MIPTFKVVLVGDGGCGKTTLLKRHLSGQFEAKYIPTLGVEVHPLRFNTNYGQMIINVWDCAGQEKFRGLGDGYYVGAQGCIVAFDLTSKVTMKNTGKWIQDMYRMNTETPFVICGMKSDIQNHEVSSQEFQQDFVRMEVPCYEVSSKSNYNFDKPFLAILQKMTGHKDLAFVTTPSKDNQKDQGKELRANL